MRKDRVGPQPEDDVRQKPPDTSITAGANLLAHMPDMPTAITAKRSRALLELPTPSR